MIIGKRFKFDAAHFLPDYVGKCKEMHGHTWIVEVEIEGVISWRTGMVLDFKDLQTVVGKYIDDLDHTVLNGIVTYPTCECIVEHLWKKLEKLYGKSLKSIKIQEGEGGWARIERK